MNKYVQQVFDQGYCVLKSLYNESECKEIISILNRAWRQNGEPQRGKSFGHVLHPVLKYAPELAPFYGRAESIDVMRGILGDEVQMAHNGALLVDETRDFCSWHCHLNGVNNWEAKPVDHNGEVSRLLCNTYLHGSNSDVGNLLVYPRMTTDSWDIPFHDYETEWQGQRVLEFPPGSSVIFDTTLWHAARRPTRTGSRYIFGGHFQGKRNMTPHREDNPCPSQEFDSRVK